MTGGDVLSIWLKDAEGRLMPQDDVTDAGAELGIVGIENPLRVTDIYEDSGICR
jgi:hypothetical protein